MCAFVSACISPKDEWQRTCPTALCLVGEDNVREIGVCGRAGQAFLGMKARCHPAECRWWSGNGRERFESECGAETGLRHSLWHMGGISPGCLLVIIDRS